MEKSKVEVKGLSAELTQEAEKILCDFCEAECWKCDGELPKGDCKLHEIAKSLITTAVSEERSRILKDFPKEQFLENGVTPDLKANKLIALCVKAVEGGK